MAKYFKEQDVEEANRILAGQSPAQKTQGVMTRAEKIASVGRAFGAKAPEKMESKRSGGYVKAADGCAQRGKTRGEFV